MRAICLGKNVVSKDQKIAIKRFLQCQFIVALCFTLIASIFWNISVGYSVSLGGLLALIPNVFFAIYFFASKQTDPKKILRSCYVSEVLKIFLTALLFILILRYCHIVFVPFLIGFSGTYGTYLFFAFKR